MEMRKEDKSNKKKWLFLSLLILILLLIVTLVFIFVKSKMNGEQEKDNTNKTYESSADALDDFFSTDSVKITGILEATNEEDGQKKQELIEIWKTNDALRIDYDIDGENYRTLIVKDNEAIYYRHGSQTKSVAVVPPEYYLELFTEKTEKNAQYVGMDDEYTGEILKVNIDTVYNMEGATNSYYIKEQNYCLSKNAFFYIETKGNTLKDGEIPTSFETSRIIFEEYELDVNIDPTVFDELF